MAFDLHYVMFSGSAVRTVHSVAEAISAYLAIRQAGGQTISIIGPAGRTYSLSDLETLLTNPIGRTINPADQDGVASME